MDADAWRSANPALGIFRSEEDLSQQMKEAERMPSKENMARNLLLNQRVSTHAPFISVGVWKQCGADVLPFEGAVFGGLDLSSRTDLTALVLIGRSGGIWQVRPYFWTPAEGLLERARQDREPYEVWVRKGYLHTTPGATVDYAYVAEAIAEIVAGLDVRAIAYDRWRMDLLSKEFDRIGLSLPLTPFGQGFKDMSPAIDSLEAELLNSRIAHGMHPVLTMCARNAVTVKDPAGGRKLDKSKGTGRIDGIQALAMAMGVAQVSPEPEVSVYEKRGLLVI